MIKKLLDAIFLLISTGILFHRCTFIGAVCGVWVLTGLQPEESIIHRMLPPDLYLFMAAFCIFYRLLFQKTVTKEGDLDLHAMSFALIGDILWCTLVMICVIFLFDSLLIPSEDTQEYSETARKAIDPRYLLKDVPRP